MMMMKFRIITAAVLILGIVLIINMIRKRKLELKYSILWLILPTVILIIIAVPGSLNGMASMLGIYDAMNMVFFLGFVFVIVVIFSLTVALSRQGERIRELTQKIALEEYRKEHEDTKNREKQ